MSVDALMAELERRGIAVGVHDGALRVTRASALDDALRAALRRHRDQIIEELQMPLLDCVLRVFGGAVLPDESAQSTMEF